MTTYDLFIANERVHAPHQERFSSINPYTGAAWASVPQASDAQVADAVATARHAYESVWRKTTGQERARFLQRLADLMEVHAERMATLETTDNGKVIRETHGQMLFAARAYRFFAGCADKIFGSTIPLDQRDVFDFTRREPLGVVVLITAWNSPMGLLSNKLAPALAAGNCVVIKPSEHASVTTLEFADLVREAGFPPGVVNIVTGDHRAGRALLASGRVDRVSFTGSPGVGRQIAAEAGRLLIPVTLELGGKSPNMIFEDADLDKAVVGALAGIFAATGQTCIAGSRLLVQRSVHDEVARRLVERARRIKLGNPLDRATEMNFRLRLRLIDKLGLGDEVADYMGLWTLTRNFINSDRGLAVMRANQANIRSNSVELYRAFVLSLLRWGRCEPEQHAEPKFTSELGKIRAPTLVVTSDNDHLIPASLSELIAAKVIGARLSVLSGAGHIPFMEQPDKVVPLVVDFINSLPVR